MSTYRCVLNMVDLSVDGDSELSKCIIKIGDDGQTVDLPFVHSNALSMRGTNRILNTAIVNKVLAQYRIDSTVLYCAVCTSTKIQNGYKHFDSDILVTADIMSLFSILVFSSFLFVLCQRQWASQSHLEVKPCRSCCTY